MDKIRRPIDKKNMLIFFVLFVINYYLLEQVYRAMLRLIFSDYIKQWHEGFLKGSADRYHGPIWWQLPKPFILLFILGLICVYTKIFKKNYFKESIIAFLTFIAALIVFSCSSKFYDNKREKDNGKIYKNLIVGKWNYKNRVVGNVIIVFNKDSTGYRFTDSNKTVQKFRYEIVKHLFLWIYSEPFKHNELCQIDSLTATTLSIRAAPFIKIKDGIDVYESSFKRESH